MIHESPDEKAVLEDLDFPTPSGIDLNLGDLSSSKPGELTAESHQRLGEAFDNLPVSSSVRTRSASIDYGEVTSVPVRLFVGEKITATDAPIKGLLFAFDGYDSFSVSLGEYSDLDADSQEAANHMVDAIRQKLPDEVDRNWLSRAWHNTKTLDGTFESDVVDGLLLNPPHGVREYVQEYSRLPEEDGTIIEDSSLVAHRVVGSEAYIADPLTIDDVIERVTVTHDGTVYEYLQHADWSESLFIGNHTAETRAQAYAKGQDRPTEDTLKRLTAAMNAVVELYSRPHGERL
jgi:hypothetical protein